MGDHISINPSPVAMQLLNRHGLIEMGFPYYGWLIAIQAAVVKMAVRWGIDLIFYGEDGEVEYGGSTQTASNPIYTVDYMKKVYLEGGYTKVLQAAGLTLDDSQFFLFPDDSELEQSNLQIAHWSYFESWDPYRNYLTAKEHCGLSESESTNPGTFTNFK